MRAAIQLAQNEINSVGGVNGQKVNVIVDDEGDTPAAAMLAVQDLIRKGVDAIIGPTSSLNVLSSLSTATHAGVLTCSPTASAMSLDDFPDKGLFFRTVPSDSLQALAIAKEVENSGNGSAAVVYLDDAYGRPFERAAVRAMRQRNTKIETTVAFSATESSIANAVAAIGKVQPRVVVVLADSASGPAVIRAIDAGAASVQPLYIVNDAMRRPDSSAAPFDKRLGARVVGVSPMAYSGDATFNAALASMDPGANGLYAANAYDCMNLIALSAQAGGSSRPSSIAGSMVSVSTGGSGCSSFPTCYEKLRNGLNPDYDGLDQVMSIGSNGDASEAEFELFSFDENGRDFNLGPLTVSG